MTSVAGHRFTLGSQSFPDNQSFYQNTVRSNFIGSRIVSEVYAVYNSKVTASVYSYVTVFCNKGIIDTFFREKYCIRS
jgi:hypothetical protein